MAFAESPRLFLAQFGKVAVRGSESAKVIFDRQSSEILDGMVRDTELAIELPSTQWPDLARNELLTVDGGSYRVRDIEPMPPDGVWKRVTLKAAA